MSNLIPFLSGAATAGFVVAALFFMRFWRQTRDSLFLFFAMAFLLLGLAHALLSLADVPLEERSWIYLIRLGAFTLILVAVVRKNLTAR